MTKVVILFLILLLAHLAHAKVCSTWGKSEIVGHLETKFLNEASGIAMSKEHAVFYLNNDSGDGPNFYVTKLDGAATQKIEVANFKPKDAEDIDVGSCPGSTEKCIAIADIGDNLERRKFVEIVFVKEQAKYGKKVEAFKKLKVTYPDGARDAEAFALLPNDEFLIVTKEFTGPQAHAAGFYRGKTNLAEQKLTKLGELDVPSLTGPSTYGGTITSMSVAPDANRILLLTYTKAIEFFLDTKAEKIPSISELKARDEIKVVDVLPLMQQEAVTYDVNGRDFYYVSEILSKIFKSPLSSPIMKVKCMDQAAGNSL